jgi:hypothetical protein
MGIVLNLKFGTLAVYDRYMIAEIKEGVVLSHEHHDVLDQIAKTYFHNTTFVYITHRIYSYTVNPMIYARTSQLSNLAGFAYVSKNKLSLTSAQLEKAFLKKPYYMGKNLEDAIQWAYEITEKEEYLVLH